VPDVFRVERAISVHVARVEDDLDRAPADLAATQPDECFQPAREFADVEHVTRREGIEVSG
jgi:hypothetical protein